MFLHADIVTQCYVDGWGGVGWDDNVHVTREVMFLQVDRATNNEVLGYNFFVKVHAYALCLRYGRPDRSLDSGDLSYDFWFLLG